MLSPVIEDWVTEESHWDVEVTNDLPPFLMTAGGERTPGPTVMYETWFWRRYKLRCATCKHEVWTDWERIPSPGFAKTEPEPVECPNAEDDRRHSMDGDDTVTTPRD